MEGNIKVLLYCFDFVGDFLGDKKHGFGVYKWADGRIYEGMWENGKQHGEGKYKQKDGSIKIGEWKNGKRIRWIDEDNSSKKPQDEVEENNES